MTNHDTTSSRVGTLAWAERTGGILSRGERIGLLGDAVRLQMRILPAQTRALLGRTNRRAFSVDPNRLSIPDTTIAREAEALCSEVSTPALRNHCLRSYAWGTILAAREGVEHDSELLYVTCLLHDLGVTDRYRDTVIGQACFAATAATIARDWSRERGWRDPRCTALADAICQHINPDVRPDHGIEAHLMQAGAGFDVIGMRHWEVATPTVKTVLARHPRLGFKKSFGSAMCAQADQHHGTRMHFLFRYLWFGARISRAPYQD
jgi:HD domain